jgi:hypothetical protein
MECINKRGKGYKLLKVIKNFNRYSTVHFDKYETFLVQQMHYLLKHKILQFVFKCLNVHFSAPTCFGPLGPSSGSTYQDLAKVTKIIVL